MKLYRWAVFGVLMACATPQPAGNNVTVVWNRVDDPQAACANLNGRKEVFALRGCSKWNDTDSAGRRICSIYARPPKSELDTQAFVTLGHELLHCFDGNWHDRWGRMNPEESQAAVGATGKRGGAAAATD